MSHYVYVMAMDAGQLLSEHAQQSPELQRVFPTGAPIRWRVVGETPESVVFMPRSGEVRCRLTIPVDVIDDADADAWTALVRAFAAAPGPDVDGEWRITLLPEDLAALRQERAFREARTHREQSWTRRLARALKKRLLLTPAA